METIAQTTVFQICPIYNLKEGIKAGKYDEIGLKPSQINPPSHKATEGHSADKKSRKSLWVILLHFDEFVTIEEVFERAGKRHCHSGNWTHLLGFVAKYPNEQYTYPIAVLGSIIKNEHGDDCVLYAYKNLVTGKSLLGLYPLKSGFHNLFRFLMVDGHSDSLIELL